MPITKHNQHNDVASEGKLQGASAERGGATARPLFSELKLQIEAVLFAAEGSLELAELRDIVGHEVSQSDIKLAIRDLNRDFEARAFHIVENAGRFQMRTRDDFTPLLRRHFQRKARTLSKSALETLAIVAYKQPVTRGEINALRGVDSASIIHSMEERELIYISGKRKDLGSPLEYRTSAKFLEIFGLTSLSELPRLRSLQMNKADEEKVVGALKSLEPEAKHDALSAEDLAFSPD